MGIKKWSGDAIAIVSEVKVMKGVEPTISSGDHIVVTYVQAYLDHSISKDKVIKVIKDCGASQTIKEWALEEIEK